MSNEKLENKDNNNNNFFEIEEKKTEKKIIDDDDEPYQVKYDRVVQKVKRVSLEDVIKFSKLNNEGQSFNFFTNNHLKENKKKNLFIVKNKKKKNKIQLFYLVMKVLIKNLF